PSTQFSPLSSFVVSAPPATPTLSLHDALPILSRPGEVRGVFGGDADAEDPRRNAGERGNRRQQPFHGPGRPDGRPPVNGRFDHRSEEHTSELQSRFDLVCRLLLEKKKERTLDT